MEIKTEPPPSVPHVKLEPAEDESGIGLLTIGSIFSIKSEPTTEITFNPNVNCFSSANISPSENSDDAEREDSVPGGSYSLRKSTVQYYNYDDNPDESSDSEPNQLEVVRKQKQRHRSLNSMETEDSKPTQLPTETAVVILRCDICSTAFFDTESLEEHVIEIHVVDKEFKCTKCSKRFISKKTLAEHKLEHKKLVERGTQRSCPICLKPLSESHFKRHQLTHEALRPFKCKLCEKSYITNRDLGIHQMNNHGKEKKFKCPKCPKSYARNYLLTDHLRTHSEARTLPCKYCGDLFRTKKYLSQHLGLCRPLEPKDDPTEENSVNIAANQLETVTSENRDLFVNPLQKQHKCITCNKIFSRRGYLKMHMNTHTDERNFRCSFCNDTFKRNTDLSRHVHVRHVRRKVHECTECKKCFEFSSVLKRHMASHSNRRK